MQNLHKKQNHDELLEIPSDKREQHKREKPEKKKRLSQKLWQFRFDEKRLKEEQTMYELVEETKSKHDGNLFKSAKWIIMNSDTKQFYLSLRDQKSDLWLKQFSYVLDDTVAEWRAPAYEWSNCLKEPKLSGCQIFYIDPKTEQTEHKKREDQKKKKLEKKEQVPDKELLATWSLMILNGKTLYEICQMVIENQDSNEARVLAQSAKILGNLEGIRNGKRKSRTDEDNDVDSDSSYDKNGYKNEKKAITRNQTQENNDYKNEKKAISRIRTQEKDDEKNEKKAINRIQTQEKNDFPNEKRSTRKIQIQEKPRQYLIRNPQEFEALKNDPTWQRGIQELKQSLSKEDLELINKAIREQYDPTFILDELERDPSSKNKNLKNAKKSQGNFIIPILIDYHNRSQKGKDGEEYTSEDEYDDNDDDKMFESEDGVEGDEMEEYGEEVSEIEEEENVNKR